MALWMQAIFLIRHTGLHLHWIKLVLQIILAWNTWLAHHVVLLLVSVNSTLNRIAFLNFVSRHIVLLILVEIIHSVIKLACVHRLLRTALPSHASAHLTASLVHVIRTVWLLSVIVVVTRASMHIIGSVTLRHILTA